MNDELTNTEKELIKAFKRFFTFLNLPLMPHGQIKAVEQEEEWLNDAEMRLQDVARWSEMRRVLPKPIPYGCNGFAI